MDIKRFLTNVVNVSKKDLKAIAKNEIVIITLLAIIILPSLYAILNIDACWDPYGSTQNLKFAVVNDDQNYTYDGESLNFGDKFVDKLENNTKFDWQFVDEKNARQGILNGSYYAAIIIPSNFTKNVLSVTTEDPVSANVEYVINQKTNPVSSRMCDAAEKTLKAELNSEIIKHVNIAAFSKLGTLQSGLASGASQLGAGASELSSGSGQLSSGAGQLSSGAGQISSASGQVSSGASQVDAGAQQIQQGAAAIEKAYGNNSASELAYKSGSLAQSSSQLASGASKLASSSSGLASSSASALYSASSALASASSGMSSASSQLSSASSQLGTVTSIDEDSLGNYFYSPVHFDKKTVNKVDSYGSEVAPFYIVLSIWVGCIITCVMIKSRYLNTKLSPLELYYGRMGLFLIVTLLQTTVTILFCVYRGIQINNFPLFVFSLYVISIVFILIMYSFISVFGEVGKAIAIILLVLQISGTGGIYPVEVMSQFFQTINPYMPMTYGITLVREASLGIYWSNYIFALIVTIGFGVATLIIATIIKEKFNESANYFEKRLEDSGLF